MKKKTIIHQFDPVIYPFKLWVSITNDLRSVGERFLEYPSETPYDTSIPDIVDCFISQVIEKETRLFGFLAVFRSVKNCTVGTISHEAIHVSDRLWKHIGENKKGSEANAYLVEWISNCIDKVKRGID